MTGLDLKVDALVEVAVIITDDDLNPIDEGIDLIINPGEAPLEHMGDFVREMHTNSGLIDEIPHGLDMEVAEKQILNYIRKRIPKAGQALLAGNSVGTDKTFLQKDMPRVIEHLHYRIIDVSTVKELAKRWYPVVYRNAPAKHGGHRALADIRESLNELQYYRRALAPTGEFDTENLKALAKTLEIK